MGSDVRVEEMLRQIRRVLGEKRVQTTVMSLEPSTNEKLFRRRHANSTARCFSRHFVYKHARKHHGVVACEGSMFKSKFANALTLMMIGSLGIAAAENKLSVGYGGDADKMDRAPENDAPLLPHVIRDSSQHRIASHVAQPRCAHGTWHGHRMDIHSASRPKLAAKCSPMPVGMAPRPC